MRKYQRKKPIREPTELEIAWMAGFLEGEGSFGRNKGYARVKATQAEPECLQRFQDWYGGSLGIENGPLRQASTSKPLWSWSLYGAQAERVMRAVLPFMSVRRRATIEVALDRDDPRWDGQQRPKTRVSRSA